MEVLVKRKSLLPLGAVALLALMIGAVGCSNSSPVAPTALDQTAIQSSIKDVPRTAQSSDFKLYGTVLAFDPVKSLLTFSAETGSDRSAIPGKYEMIVSKNAVVVLLSSREAVSFDAKYLSSGTTMTIFGSYDRDGTMIVDRMEIGMALPGDVSSSSSM